MKTTQSSFHSDHPERVLAPLVPHPAPVIGRKAAHAAVRLLPALILTSAEFDGADEELGDVDDLEALLGLSGSFPMPTAKHDRL
jgi:hypothetical protein